MHPSILYSHDKPYNICVLINPCLEVRCFYFPDAFGWLRLLSTDPVAQSDARVAGQLAPQLPAHPTIKCHV